MLAAALVVYWASGFAALLYQVIWQRMLVMFAGSDVHASTIVVAAFMAGLGIGSIAGGLAADRVSSRTGALLFAACELAAAAFGAVSAAFFHRFLYERIAVLAFGRAATAAILFGSLLWPTFFMGASLPLLTRTLTRSLHRVAATVGALYAFNTLGAAAGALCTTWLLVPRSGLDGSVRIGVVLNLACAIAAVIFAAAGRTNSATSGRPVAEAGFSQVADPVLPGLAFYAGMFAVSGFVALSFEIVWFRLLGVMLKATSYTFGTVLAIYLLGLGAGAAVGSALANRIRGPLAAFGLLQGAAALSAVTALAVFVSALPAWAPLRWISEYFGRADHVDAAALYVLVPALLVGPPTFMMGCSFPLLQKVAHDDLRSVGRRVGILMAANIAGSTAGAFVTGWTMLDWLGTSGSLRLLGAVSFVFLVLAARAAFASQQRTRRVAYAAAAAVVLAASAAVPGSGALWAALHGTTPERIIAAEDASGLSVLRVESAFEDQEAARVLVFINGLAQSWLPYGDIHTVLGALPAFFHRSPRTAAIIGLGSGDTVYAMGGRPEIERITSIEIIEPQLVTLRALARRYPYPPLQTITTGSRVEHLAGDGRLRLTRDPTRYDIIEADALRPNNAFSGTVYSDAYFALLRSRLNPNGLAVSWAPTERVARTFIKVFPHVWRAGQILVGSNDPIVVDRDAVLNRLMKPDVDGYYRWANVDIARLMRPYLRGPFRRYGPDADRSTLVDINTDLFPKDEFDLEAGR